MMRWSATLIPTLKQTPADAEVPSHQLMLRAGLIQKVASGSYCYLPLGRRVMAKVMAIVRAEMDGAGAVEVLLPALQPIEWWERTGRRADYGRNLFVVTDRHGREVALGPTHEEVITTLVGQTVSSYRQLPLTLYQIQTKFRDEFRPRFGVLRSREFQMKDAYSFDLTVEGLEESYQKMYDAYCRIFDRCGLNCEIVEAESGPIGGSGSHEFMVPSPTGEDVIVRSNKGNYAANLEKAAVGDRTYSFDGAPTGALEQVHTPGCDTIEQVCRFMKVKPRHLLKTLVFGAFASDKIQDEVFRQSRQTGAPIAGPAGHYQFFAAVVRGDCQINEAKLRRLMTEKFPDLKSIGLAIEDKVRQYGFAVGYVGPHVIRDYPDVILVVDPDAAQDQFWVTGANKSSYHVKHFDWKRDVLDPLGDEAKERVFVADIRNVVEGDPSSKDDGGVLTMSRGIEVGHVFKLGDKYTRALGVTVLDENNKEVHPIMGCYGIGVNRIIAAVIEAEGGHDEHGVIWPMSIAPFHAIILLLDVRNPTVTQVAEKLYQDLQSEGIETLLDDRDARPGVKFKDADLIGIPIRITVGEKGLKAGGVEIKHRRDPRPRIVEPEKALAAVKHVYDADLNR